MGKTFRKYAGLRNPRGRKQALQRGDRKVPPSSWEKEEPTSRQNQAYKIAWRLAERGWDPDRVAHRLMSRARKSSQDLTHAEALEIALSAAERFDWDQGRKKHKVDWEKIRKENESKAARSEEVLKHLAQRLPQLRKAYKAADAQKLVCWARDKLENIWKSRIYPRSWGASRTSSCISAWWTGILPGRTIRNLCEKPADTVLPPEKEIIHEECLHPISTPGVMFSPRSPIQPDGGQRLPPRSPGRTGSLLRRGRRDGEIFRPIRETVS